MALQYRYGHDKISSELLERLARQHLAQWISPNSYLAKYICLCLVFLWCDFRNKIDSVGYQRIPATGTDIFVNYMRRFT